MDRAGLLMKVNDIVLGLALSDQGGLERHRPSF
jgi:hypothetical protein